MRVFSEQHTAVSVTFINEKLAIGMQYLVMANPTSTSASVDNLIIPRRATLSQLSLDLKSRS